MSCTRTASSASQRYSPRSPCHAGAHQRRFPYKVYQDCGSSGMIAEGRCAKAHVLTGQRVWLPGPDSANQLRHPADPRSRQGISVLGPSQTFAAKSVWH
eukprot:2276277-Rhodomonas_salina.1